MSNWFENWFDSPYYHKLYFDRDEEEAALFIKNLMQFLQPKPNSFMLDVACGKGRHAITMHSYGHTVTGIDISPASIAFANQYASDTLEFFKHDMRLTFRINYYDYAFNLFTSFGYFDNERQNDDALRTIAQSIKPKGFFIMDYLNVNYVANKLIPFEKKVMDTTTFTIKRKKTATHFEKEIIVEDVALANSFSHTEKVATYTLADFEKMFLKQKLSIVNIFGSYDLEPFDFTTSKRLIMIAQKQG
jgi:SAM-dependent methyltransferase